MIVLGLTICILIYQNLLRIYNKFQWDIENMLPYSYSSAHFVLLLLHTFHLYILKLDNTLLYLWLCAFKTWESTSTYSFLYQLSHLLFLVLFIFSCKFKLPSGVNDVTPGRNTALFPPASFVIIVKCITFLHVILCNNYYILFIQFLKCVKKGKSIYFYIVLYHDLHNY